MNTNHVELRLIDYTYKPGKMPTLTARFHLSAGDMSADWIFVREKAFDVSRALEDCRKEIQQFAKLLAAAADNPKLLNLQQ